jgi:hypothetical protein
MAASSSHEPSPPRPRALSRERVEPLGQGAEGLDRRRRLRALGDQVGRLARFSVS